MNVHSVFSKVDAGRLLCLIANATEPGPARHDLSPSAEKIQAAVVRMDKGKVVAPHIHQPLQLLEPEVAITQESWVVLQGKIRVRVFDVDRVFLEDAVLFAGSMLVNFHAGHSLECLEDGTVMLEFKNGPYRGPDFQTFPLAER